MAGRVAVELGRERYVEGGMWREGYGGREKSRE
jgi:hypothetical protein